MQYDLKKSFSLRFAALLDKEDLNQTEFAKELGLSHSTINKWVNGNALPDTEMLARIAQRFHVSTDELLFGVAKEENTYMVRVPKEDYELVAAIIRDIAKHRPR